MNVSVSKGAEHPNSLDRVDSSSFFRLDSFCNASIATKMIQVYDIVYIPRNPPTLSLSFSSLDDLTWPNFRGQIMSNPPAVNSGGLVCKELDPSLFGASRVVSLPNKKQQQAHPNIPSNSNVSSGTLRILNWLPMHFSKDTVDQQYHHIIFRTFEPKPNLL